MDELYYNQKQDNEYLKLVRRKSLSKDREKVHPVDKLSEETNYVQKNRDLLEDKVSSIKDENLNPAAPATLKKLDRWDRKRVDSNTKMLKKINSIENDIKVTELNIMTKHDVKTREKIFEYKKKIIEYNKEIGINNAVIDKVSDVGGIKLRKVKIKACEEMVKLYDELIESLPENEVKKRNSLYKEKEAIQVRQHRMIKRNKIEEIPNSVERKRELSTYERHKKFDRRKTVFYKPTRLAIEGAEFDYKGKHLVNVGRAFMGGTKPMYYYEDRNAPVTDDKGKVIGYKRYLYKEAVTCNGRKKVQGALVTEAASKLQRIICGPYSISAFAAKSENGEVLGSFQEMVVKTDDPNSVDLFSWQAAPKDNLTEQVKEEMLREHTLDWLLCNFDTKGENFLQRKVDGHLTSIDKEASFSHIESDKAWHMSYHYKPHNNDTIYNVLFKEYIKGTLNLDFTATLKRAEEIAGMDDDDYMAGFEEMLRDKYKDKAKYEHVKGLILQRKRNLVQEYNSFITRLKEEREKNKELEKGDLDTLHVTYEKREKIRKTENNKEVRERKDNWNLSEEEMSRIDALLQNEKNEFRSQSSVSIESTLERRNSALKKIKNGDYSEFNHIPGYLREYFARKELNDFFGNDYVATGNIPELSDDIKERIKEKLTNPIFRFGINELIKNKAVNDKGDPQWERLTDYEKYMNKQLMIKTLAPVEKEEADRLKNKFPKADKVKGFDSGRTMLKNNAVKQRHVAKLLFLTQLGRFDQYDTREDGKSTTPFKENTVEAISHGARLAITMPAGTDEQQKKIFEAWEGTAGNQMYGRFATHEFNRRQVDEKGNMTKSFHETRLKGKKANKKDYIAGNSEEKPTSYMGNYGMNLSVGGLGQVFNGSDVIEDQGRFGHLYQRVRKGDKTHCGTILFGFENSAPHGAINIRKHFGGYNGTSSVGQTHNSNAISHDFSTFYSSKQNYGDKIGGREVDLSHVDPDVLAKVIAKFDNTYKELQRKAKQISENGQQADQRSEEEIEQERKDAVKKLNILNEKLAGERMTANDLYLLLKICGVAEATARDFVRNARSMKDSQYDKGTVVPNNLRVVSLKKTNKEKANEGFFNSDYD